MLVETWVAIPLRWNTEIELPAGWLAGCANWWLEGTWGARIAVPALGAGAVAARLYAAIRAVDPTARVRLADGALEPFEAVGTAAPAEGLEAIPAAWASGLVDGTVHAALRAEGLCAAVTGRYASRTRVDVPALRVVVRGIWADLLPNGTDAEDPHYPRDLARALERPEGIADLRELLLQAGDRVGARLAERFADQCGPPPEVRSRVVVYERADGLDEVLRGLPTGAERHVRTVGRWFGAVRPQIDVVRRDRSGGLDRWHGEPDEVLHAR